MSQSVSPAQKSRSILSGRRLVLLASAAVIGAGVLFGEIQELRVRAQPEGQLLQFEGIEIHGSWVRPRRPCW